MRALSGTGGISRILVGAGIANLLLLINPFIHMTDIFQCLPEMLKAFSLSPLTAESKIREQARGAGARGWRRDRLGQAGREGSGRNPPGARTTQCSAAIASPPADNAPRGPARRSVTDVNGRLGALKTEAVWRSRLGPRASRDVSQQSGSSHTCASDPTLGLLAPLSPAMGRSRRTGAHRARSLARQMKAKRRRPDLDEIHRELRPQVPARSRPDPASAPDPDLPGGGLHRCLACT